MWKYLMAFAALLLLSGCVVYPYDYDNYYHHNYYHDRDYRYRDHDNDYRYSKSTNFMKLHWNMVSQDNGTVVAEGYVEPFNPDNGLNAVKLRLVGLDAQGNVVNSAEGMTKDTYIESPFYPASPFSIAMKLNGQEKAFTMAGNYYHYKLGEGRRLDARHLDYIPVSSR